MKPEENVLFRSFGREAAGTSNFHNPCSIDEVRTVFASAKKAGQRVAVRGGGHSFHDQALHKDDTGRQIILGSGHFNSITPAPNGDPNTVLLGAGVKWIDYFNAAVAQAQASGGPLRLPGSMQT
jgi:FAD/FMN-containing dehydrogenase